jgi:hypothetical protein
LFQDHPLIWHKDGHTAPPKTRVKTLSAYFKLDGEVLVPGAGRREDGSKAWIAMAKTEKVVLGFRTFLWLSMQEDETARGPVQLADSLPRF